MLKIELLFVVDVSRNIFSFTITSIFCLTYTVNTGYEFVRTIYYNILKMTLTARMLLKTTILTNTTIIIIKTIEQVLIAET
jgi:hypothetical protein